MPMKGANFGATSESMLCVSMPDGTRGCGVCMMMLPSEAVEGALCPFPADLSCRNWSLPKLSTAVKARD